MYEITGQPNLKWNKEKVLTSQRINDCMTDIHDHWYSPCVSMSMNHNVWCSVNHATAQLRNRTTAPEWSNISNHAHSPRRTEITICMRVAATCTNSPVCREPVCHLSSALSHCPIEKHILWSRSLCKFVPASLYDCMLYRLRTSDPESLVVKAL